MGFLRNLFGKNKTTENTNTGIPMNNITAANDINNDSLYKINLRKDKINKICLEKKELTNLTSRVGMVIDRSASMNNLYNNGSVQTLAERIIPLALQFDDNQEMDMWFFNNLFKRLPSININNYKGYIDEQSRNFSMGGTEFAPILRDIKRKYVDEEPSKIPTYIVFITDGECWDKDESTQIIKELSKYNIFIQFIGINEGSAFLEKLDTMKGRYIDNANYFYVKDLNNISDDELYKKLLTEYPLYLVEAKKKGLV